MDVVPTIPSASDGQSSPSYGGSSPPYSQNEAGSHIDNSNHRQISVNETLNTNADSSRAVIALEESAAATVEQQPEEPEEDGPMPIQDDEDGGLDEDDDDYEYEYEDEDDANFGGFLQVDNPPPVAAASAVAVEQDAVEPAKIEEDDQQLQQQQQQQQHQIESLVPEKKPQWREPSREAVNMSLRAEKETTGSKRRLAQDLYRIMNKDTDETGFSLKPSSDDSMDKWTIRLFQFDNDSNLAKDMMVLGIDSIKLEMSFPDQYPFEPPFVRVVQPRFKRQTGFVMNGAICMELLTNEGWNPVNDIESVIVSVRSLLVVGEGRLEAAYNLPEAKYKSLLETAQAVKSATNSDDGLSGAEEEEDDDDNNDPGPKRQRKNSVGDSVSVQRKREELSEQQRRLLRGEKSLSYSEADAKAAYEHLSTYHKKKGWDTSGWWARKG